MSVDFLLSPKDVDTVAQTEFKQYAKDQETATWNFEQLLNLDGRSGPVPRTVRGLK